MRPLIGVTTSELRPSGMATLRRQGEPDHPEMALGMTYLQAIERAGAVPVVLPPCVSDLESLIARLDGVCLSGGPDLDPEAYGARERHAELGPTEPSLDTFELALARAALERGMPLLGICRGSQALNVACGGTLHQHLPGHRQSEPGPTTTHEVEVLAGTRLAGLIGPGSYAVNSFHHQAVDEIGQGLRVAALAADGMVEAVEGGAGFAIGVQWHAETLADARLFEALVGACAPGLRIAA
ncbi:MAG TPA: gamma-glutamyl-gamma-aminobutyrate hydrolase family protein [Solirubrobacteraceae bacterium]|nr:gamma-glutamyl-gamma-aminobutyrate hydrolase family protein [Solirubrobacteraceae bacterium]